MIDPTWPTLIVQWGIKSVMHHHLSLDLCWIDVPAGRFWRSSTSVKSSSFSCKALWDALRCGWSAWRDEFNFKFQFEMDVDSMQFLIGACNFDSTIIIFDNFCSASIFAICIVIGSSSVGPPQALASSEQWPRRWVRKTRATKTKRIRKIWKQSIDISVGSTMPPCLGVSHSVRAMVFAVAECAPPPGLELSHDGVDPTMALRAALLAERQALFWRFQQQLTQNISPPGVWSMPPPWSVWNSWPAAAAEPRDDKSDQLSDVSTDIVSSACDAESSAASVVDVGEWCWCTCGDWQGYIDLLVFDNLFISCGFSKSEIIDLQKLTWVSGLSRVPFTLQWQLHWTHAGVPQRQTLFFLYYVSLACG